MKTYSAKPDDIHREWYVVDATDKVLGRLASQIALRLRGKHKPIFTPHMDTGDFIVVTNVEKIRVTGNKAEDKLYHRHSGYPGGIPALPPPGAGIRARPSWPRSHLYASDSPSH